MVLARPEAGAPTPVLRAVINRPAARLFLYLARMLAWPVARLGVGGTQRRLQVEAYSYLGASLAVAIARCLLRIFTTKMVWKGEDAAAARVLKQRVGAA